MGNGLRNLVAGISGLVLLCCVGSVSRAELEPDCSVSACECPSGTCPEAECASGECSSCDCPSGKCADCCAANGCQQCCSKSAATNSTTAVLVVDAELLVPVVPMTLQGLMGGALPSDVIAQLATTPTGLASCCCESGNCGQCNDELSTTCTPGTLAHRVLAVRTVLQNTPNCSLQLDPATFTLFSGADATNLISETNIILARFSDLEQNATTCCATVNIRPVPVSPEQATALREAANQLAKVAVSLEEADLKDQAARARSLASAVVAGLQDDATTADNENDAVAQPPQEELLR